MSTADKNFWKEKYQTMWGASSEREAKIASLITEATGKEVEFVGLGAGSKEFIDGAAVDNGHLKGSADLHIVDSSIFIEVTGPLVTFVKPDAPLWIRPDKIEAAKSLIAQHDTWLVHHLPFNDLLRVIHLDSGFMERYDKGEFKTVRPTIRGQVETYTEIPPNDSCVETWDILLQRINEGLQ